MANVPISVRLDENILKFVDAEAARRRWSRNAVIQTCVEYSLPDLEREPVGKPRKKIAEISAGGGGAENGGTPDLSRLGKAQEWTEVGNSLVQAAASGGFPEWTEAFNAMRQLPDAVPCDHAGCLSHLSHPCEGCGRIGGRRPIYNMEDNESAQKNRGGSVSAKWWITKVAEAGGFKNLSPELSNTLKDEAKTNREVAIMLIAEKVELDREILVRWGLAENYKPITFENQRGVPGSEVVVNRNQIRPLVDRNKSEDEVGGGKNMEGSQSGESGASAGKNRRVAKGLPKNDDGGKSSAVGVGKPKVDMAALRDICAGNVSVPKDAFAEYGDPTFSPHEIDLCGFKSYNEIDGENYICGKEVHGPKVNHGDWIKV